MQQIQDIEKVRDFDLTRKAQNGLKRNKSTLTAGLTLQSTIGNNLDIGEHAAMANLDFRTAFHIVNIETLIKRL